MFMTLIRGVDQRVEAELGLDGRADVLGLAHLTESFSVSGDRRSLPPAADGQPVILSSPASP
jgi:hypothetical protein